MTKSLIIYTANSVLIRRRGGVGGYRQNKAKQKPLPGAEVRLCSAEKGTKAGVSGASALLEGHRGGMESQTVI